MSKMNDHRDWLLLTLKYSGNNEVLWWYATGCCGYTPDLMKAGRYSEDEAKAEARRVPHHLRAVRLSDVATDHLTVIAVGSPLADRLLALPAAVTEGLVGG